MPTRWIELVRRLARPSGLASVALISQVGQGTQPPPPPPPPADVTSSYAALVLAIAVIGPIVLGAITAAAIWLISLGAPPAVVGSESPQPAAPREVLPPGVHMPPSSIRPLIIGIGLTIISFGVIMRDIAISLSPDVHIPIIVVLGVLVMAVGLLGWIRDDYRAAGRR